MHSSDEMPTRGTEKILSINRRIIGEYKLLSLNCNTIVCDTLKKSETKFFEFSQIEEYLD